MSQIAIVVTSLHRLIEHGVKFVFTDRHAKLETADFSSNLDDLSRLPWKLWQQRDFRIDPNKPDKKERYQAEALVYRHLPTEALLGIVCYGQPQCLTLQDAAKKRSKGIPIVVNPGMYF